MLLASFTLYSACLFGSSLGKLTCGPYSLPPPGIYDPTFSIGNVNVTNDFSDPDCSGRCPEANTSLIAPSFWLIKDGDFTNWTSITDNHELEKRKYIVVVHGIYSSFEDWRQNISMMIFLERLYQATTSHILIIDWTTGANSSLYDRGTIAMNTQIIGKIAGQFVFLRIDTRIVGGTCIGHDYGAYVCAFFFRSIGESWARDNELIALNPTGHCFDDSALRITFRDGHFVNVIHSDISIGTNLPMHGLGDNNDWGRDPRDTLDMYPNGGVDQPGCNGSAICANFRALELYNASLSSDPNCDDRSSFLFCPCHDFEKYYKNIYSEGCDHFCWPSEGQYLGHKALNIGSSVRSGLYFGQTTANKPFCHKPNLIYIIVDFKQTMEGLRRSHIVNAMIEFFDSVTPKGNSAPDTGLAHSELNDFYVEPSRPMHHVMKSNVNTFKANISKIIVHNFASGISGAITVAVDQLSKSNYQVLGGHIILISDGQDVRNWPESVLKFVTSHGVTVHTLMLPPNAENEQFEINGHQNAKKMGEIARWTGGHYDLVPFYESWDRPLMSMLEILRRASSNESIIHGVVLESKQFCFKSGQSANYSILLDNGLLGTLRDIAVSIIYDNEFFFDKTKPTPPSPLESMAGSLQSPSGKTMIECDHQREFKKLRCNIDTYLEPGVWTLIISSTGRPMSQCLQIRIISSASVYKADATLQLDGSIVRPIIVKSPSGIMEDQIVTASLSFGSHAVLRSKVTAILHDGTNGVQTLRRYFELQDDGLDDDRLPDDGIYTGRLTNVTEIGLYAVTLIAAQSNGTSFIINEVKLGHPATVCLSTSSTIRKHLTSPYIRTASAGFYIVTEDDRLSNETGRIVAPLPSGFDAWPPCKWKIPAIVIQVGVLSVTGVIFGALMTVIVFAMKIFNDKKIVIN